MKKTALAPWRGITMLAGMVLLSLGACKKDVSVPPSDAATSTDLTRSVNFKSKTLATALTSYTSSPVINYTNQHDITISGLSIKGGSVPSITLTNCYNVHITQCSLGNSSTVAINTYNCYNITIDYNYFTNASTGIYVVSTTKGGIVIQNNQFLNIQGPYPRGQAIQFNQVSGAGNVISGNRMENIAGYSNTYESVNMYKSNGTAASPITITGNWFRGGGPNNASAALQLGDNGGSYITATNNIIVNSGAVGISVSGGDHIVATNNSVYSSKTSYTNVGIVVWAQGGYAVTNCTVSGNKVNWTNSSGEANHYWIGPSTPTPTGWSTNTWGAAINSTLLPSAIISATAATVPLTPAGTTTVSGSTASAATSGPISYTGKSNITISGANITGGSSPCIHLINCSNVFINKCNLVNSSNVAVLLDNCNNIVIQENTISNVEAGVVANNCTGGIKVFTNQMKNMVGPSYGAAFVQFNGVSGANNNINWNKMQNIKGQSNPVYEIDIVNSNGTSASPINISTNQIEGWGTGTSGGGIQLGRNGGSYQTATGNTLVNTGTFGMCIIGGNNMSITSNKIYAGAATWTNVGIFVQSQGGLTVGSTTISGNHVNWTNSTGSQSSEWLASGIATPSGWSTNTWGANISASILPASLF